MCGCSHNENKTRRRLETIRGTMGEDNVDKGGQMWTKVDKCGQMWTKVDKGGQRWTKESW